MPVQRGFALIAILSLAALIAAFLIASALNLTSADNSNQREQRSMNALRQAKAALIAYAASEQWQLYKTPGTYFQPGALPCPDKNDTGDADCAFGSNTASMIGRLPFKTLGIEDLRDASGERLWYALSHDFRKNQCPGTGCTTINSDTLGQLTVTGTAPATQVVAIVFAPGEAIQGQNRDPTNASAHNDPLNYLEGPPNLSDPVNYVFTTNALPSDTFNDRVLVITQADLMAAVEPVVAARIERDVKPLLADYFNKWGAYPFAMTFVAPPSGQAVYQGASNQTRGLLPLTNDPNVLAWASATVTSIVGSGTGIYDGTTNTISPNPTSCTIASSQATCTINYSGGSNDRPDIKLEIFLANANKAFADTPSMNGPETLAMVKADGITPLNTQLPYGQWSAVGSYPPTLSSFVLQAVGPGAVVTYTGRLQNAGTTSNRVTITIPLSAPSYLQRLTNPSSTNPNIAWFLSNKWYRQTYYAMSPGYAPGGVPLGTPATCNPLPATPSCLRVNNLPGTTNNKRAILVFFGRALDGQIRPGTLANYLEGENSTPTDLIFEHRAGTATAINDRVVVVSP